MAKSSLQNAHYSFAIRAGFFAALFFFATLFFSARPFTSAPCANSISCISNLSGTVSSNTKGTFLGQAVTAPSTIPIETNVLGDSNASNKHIVVDLTTQTLTAYEGTNQVFAFLVSTGKWGPTPTGDFRIWIKLRATRMVGGNKALGTFYDLPNVPYTMYFYNAQVPKYMGYGLHGAYWHHNFGHPMSHGCVNLAIEDAHRLYDWVNPVTTGNTTYATDADPGTLITITGVAPKE